MAPVAVVFDLDGTLIDSAPDIRGIANTLLAARDLPPLDLAETVSFIGSGAFRTARIEHCLKSSSTGTRAPWS